MKVAPDIIAADDELAALCRELRRAPWIAFDTEFVAEDTYRPQLCLVQVATDESLVIIDSLAVSDMNPFWELITGDDHEIVVHAGREEMEFCLEAVGRLPERVVDVQIAAALVGLDYPAGYGTLTQRLLGQEVAKHETRTDWRRRPLSNAQISYALDDVRHLGAVRTAIDERLKKLGRLDWLKAEMNDWLRERVEHRNRERWRRVSGAANLSPRELIIVRELWRWREEEASTRDVPPRRVLRDDLIVELARRRTAEAHKIRAVRGFERRGLRNKVPDLAKCIARALALPKEEWPVRPPRDSNPQLAMVSQFLAMALGSICRKNNIAMSLAATTKDIRDFVSYRLGDAEGEPPSLARGWRSEVVGQMLDDLLSGKVAIRIHDPKSDAPLSFERPE